MPGCSLRRASASLHVGTQPGRARQSSWAAGSQLNAAGTALAPAALEHCAGGSPSPAPSSSARTALVPSQTSQSPGMLGSRAEAGRALLPMEEVATREQSFPSAPYIYCKVLWL